MQYGSAEHAHAVTDGRFSGTRDGLQWLTYAHLPEKLQKFSEVFYQAAVDLLNRIPIDSPELTTALNKLIEAKDSAMRAGIRNDTGRAGSVPRPQEVVDPPTFETAPCDGNCGSDDPHDAHLTANRSNKLAVPLLDNRIGPNFGRPIEQRQPDAVRSRPACSHGVVFGAPGWGPDGHLCGELPSDSRQPDAVRPRPDGNLA